MISIRRPAASSSSSAGPDDGQHLLVVRAGFVEPEDGRRAGRARPIHRELHPVLDDWALRLAHPPDVAGLDVVLHQHVPVAIEDADGPGLLELECLVVRAVLLGRLRHQADVRRRAHRRRIERAMLAAVVDRLGVERGIGVIGDHELRVLLLAVGIPHLSRRADGPQASRHR